MYLFNTDYSFVCIDLIQKFSSKCPSTIKNIIQLSTIMLNKHNNND